MIENNNNNEDEKPVEFYHEKDLLGEEKKNADALEENRDAEAANLPYSDYQSVKHFWILCVFSFGIYPFFWFFKHWQHLRDEKRLDISPSFRTAFTLFFGYSLFLEFHKLALEKGYKKKLPLFLIFLVYIVMAIAAALKLGIFILMSFFAFLPLIPILKMMNFYYLKEQPDYQIKKKLTKGEKIFLLSIWGGLIFLALVS